MTQKLITAAPDMSVKQAFLTMRTNHVRHLPVLADGELIGIISDRDLRRPRWAESDDDWTSYYRIDDQVAVKDVMIANPETVRVYDPILRAVRLFREHRYGALPVLDKKGDMVGMLSPQDLLLALEEMLVDLGKGNAKSSS
jgi:acetoin utilization protein AcuB